MNKELSSKIKTRSDADPGTYRFDFTDLNSSPQYEGVLEVQDDERCDSVGKPNLCR